MSNSHLITIMIILCLLFVASMKLASSFDYNDVIEAELVYSNIVAGVIIEERRRIEELEVLMHDLYINNEREIESASDAYLMFKRFAIRRRSIERLIAANTAGQRYVASMRLWESNFQEGRMKDMAAAVNGILRLQQVYQLPPSELFPIEAREKYLDMYDYLSMGKVCVMRSQIYKSIDWLRLAVASKIQNDVEAVNTIGEFAYILLSTLAVSELYSQHQHSSSLSDADRTFLMSLVAKDKFELRQNLTMEEWLDEDSDGFRVTEVLDDKVTETNNFSALCRGEQQLHPSITKHLYCIYYHNSSPYLLLQPVKAEIAYDDPLVVVFHNILSESTTDSIVELALKTGMSQAVVNNVQSGSSQTVVAYRTASSSWLGDEYSSVAELSSLIAQVTGLDLSWSEKLQAANYGPAGHYSPHLDDHRPVDLLYAEQHNIPLQRRVATFMLYASDVQMGGATVFPRLGLAIQPKKGSAVFWYNMLESWDVDTRTLHGGCPVAVGKKWVFNKWIDAESQTFRRPCRL